MQDERRHRMTDVYARLAPGATVGAAQAELRQIAARLHDSYPEAYPKSRGFDTVVTPWKDELTARARPTLMILLVTTVFVLIIACANVANLTLTRLVQREREMAIRAALGARGALLRRQLLAENLVLSVVGGVLGLGLAVAGLDLLTKYASRFTNRTGEIALDGWVLSFTLIVSIALALLFAWAPRLGFLDDPVRAMASGGGRATGSPGRRRAQRALVVSQLAASFMLLIGAGLLTRSLHAALRGRSGVRSRQRAQPAGAGLHRVQPRAPACSSRATSSSASGRRRRCSRRRWPRRRRWPDRSRSSRNSRSTAPISQAVASAPKTVTRVVSSGYFETVGTRLKAGRAFLASDSATAPPVVILSESMARYYFKDQSPIGRRLSWKLFNGNWSPKAEIVGVAADTRADGIEQTPLHTMYQPDAQTSAQSTLLVRTAGSTDRHRAARGRDDPQPRSEPPDRSRADARGDPRRDDRAAAAQRDADRTVRAAGARDCHGRRRRRARLLGQPAHQRARHPAGARRRAAARSCG